MNQSQDQIRFYWRRLTDADGANMSLVCECKRRGPRFKKGISARRKKEKKNRNQFDNEAAR